MKGLAEFEQRVARATHDLFNEWMRLGDSRPTWMVFIAPRVAAAIRAAATEGPTQMRSPEGEHFVEFNDADEAALAALRGHA